MDTPAPQPEDPHLAALLDQALATPPMRASLMDDIVAATTPLLGGRTSRLLDAALAADAPAASLTDRILRATVPILYRRRRPVIGFLGLTPAYRVAAGVLLAAMVGIWGTLASIASNAHELARIEIELEEISGLAAASDSAMDQEIDRLDEQLDSLQVSTAWDAERIVGDEAARWPVEAPVSEMPWLF